MLCIYTEDTDGIKEQVRALFSLKSTSIIGGNLFYIFQRLIHNDFKSEMVNLCLTELEHTLPNNYKILAFYNLIKENQLTLEKEGWNKELINNVISINVPYCLKKTYYESFLSYAFLDRKTLSDNKDIVDKIIEIKKREDY